jgi:beta-mannosidase
VTGNDTDPAYVAKNAGAEGSDTLGMIWKINGAAVMSKGANQIPMEELEGRMRGDAHRIMVQSAVDANMNTLRVW